MIRLASRASKRMNRLGPGLFLYVSNFFISQSNLPLLKCFGFGGAHDSKLDGLAGYRRSRTGRKRGSNAARDFSRWVHRNNKAFPVKISTIHIPVLLKKRNKTGAKKVQRCQVDHHVIHFSDWFRSIMANFPKFFLGGWDRDLDCAKYEAMFSLFWKNFEGLQPNHPIYSKPADIRARSVPIAIHGDEGRGLAKVPLLVISFQVLIPFTGENNLSQTLILDWSQSNLEVLYFLL